VLGSENKKKNSHQAVITGTQLHSEGFSMCVVGEVVCSAAFLVVVLCSILTICFFIQNFDIPVFNLGVRICAPATVLLLGSWIRALGYFPTQLLDLGTK
jgi:hypothetical protein